MNNKKRPAPLPEPVFYIKGILISSVLRDLLVLVGLDDLGRDREQVVVRLERAVVAGLAIHISVGLAGARGVLISESVLADTLIHIIACRGILGRIL